MSSEKVVQAKAAVDMARGKLISALRKYELPADVRKLLAKADKASERFYVAWLKNEQARSKALLKLGTDLPADDLPKKNKKGGK